MKKLILFICFLSSACSNQTMLPMPNPELSNFPIWAVKYIDVSDGVELYEAKLIAKAFFVSGVSTCGYPGDPSKINGKWLFPTYIAKRRDPDKDIVIDIKSGDLDWNGKHYSFSAIQKLDYVY